MKLEVRDLSFWYEEKGRQILSQFSLSADSSERVGIIAPSGFGKTTLCKILSGYETPQSGKVLLDGKTLKEYGTYCPVQMIWQHPELSVNPARRLKMVLAEGDWPEDGGVMRGRIEKEMGILEEWKERYPAEVSGGELQRFSIARALGQRTEILLADEITAMLDLITQRQIWSALLKETQSRGISLVAVSHSQELLEKINELGTGPQGFGGRTTALGLQIETFPTHIAGLPVAVNINCHVTRHAEVVL